MAAEVELRSKPADAGASRSPENGDSGDEGPQDQDQDHEHEHGQEHARPRRRTRRAYYGYSCRYNREVKKRGRLPGSVSLNTQVKQWTSTAKAQGQSSRNDVSVGSPAFASPEVTLDTNAQFPVLTPGAVDAATRSSTKSVDGSTGPDDSRHQHRAHPHLPPISSTALPPPPGRFPSSHDARLPRRRTASLAATAMDIGMGDSDVFASDESAGQPSPMNGNALHDLGGLRRSRPSFRSVIATDRGSFSTNMTTAPDAFAPDFLQKAPTEDCCYRFLDPVLPYIRNIVPASVACEMLDIFLTDPGSSLFRGASPYILTRIFRKQSITHPSNPRRTTPALLAAILWCVAQTADIMLLHVPGSRAKIVNDLYDLATSLIAERDPDRWRRIHGGLRPEHEVPHPHARNPASVPTVTPANEPAGEIDDVLTFILLSIAVSGGDFKSDCYKWWSKATRLALSLRLNREDEQCVEHREERRRVFWLLYSLDRHLSLSFNTFVSIPDAYCEVYCPLPEHIWENLDSIALDDLPRRVYGPPTTVTGTGFLEYFLPLMTILGDIIDVHHRRNHPRLGGLDDTHAVAVIQDLLRKMEMSLESLTSEFSTGERSSMALPSLINHDSGRMMQDDYVHTLSPIAHRRGDHSRLELVRAYSTHILHVLHVLLHGKWDAISMLDDGDDWITSRRFTECASHAISASQSVSTILQIDPELTFMSYLFGIYLLQGSFILLLFADRMPQLGPNESVELACENIIRAHEVCVVTLSTEFQKNFRRVLRSTLYSVRSLGTPNWEEHRARRRALSLYRWTRGAKGLGL
ncbi:hypothetical protein S40285_05910 [Stachybotrys chlorohalonatus IBT 40285]|uniref:Xylanolytic transcriptional activator regulatory domain-containing protein n=1 Tax=Stachybotrys chlorohalonatus (strain IBT 40285) TaxID=1283841 RepID=A0A084QGM0_STAC4|nr:hypothetical protein S40285_05910 [Stachybotrys chlorohalonata IBT 40285]